MMAEIKRPTKREVLTRMLEEGVIQTNEDYKYYVEHELELLDRKNASSKGSKTNEENVRIGKMLLEEMAKFEATGKAQYTITELMKFSEVIQDYVCDNEKALSNSKISAIFQKMLENENAPIVNVKDKKVSLYSLAK